jgi:hypothetical protein
MRVKCDDLISTLAAVMHYKFDRYDPELPDLYGMLATDAMLRTLEVLGLAIRSGHESGETIWRATPELKQLAKAVVQTSWPTGTDHSEAEGA